MPFYNPADIGKANPGAFEFMRVQALEDAK